MSIRFNMLAAALMALLLTGCSKTPVPVHADLAISAEMGTEDGGAPMPALWNTDDSLGICISHDHKIGGKQPVPHDNIRYTNTEGEASHTARFITDAPADICEGDIITGYHPYSTLRSSTANGTVRPFTLGAQLQNGDNSTAHIEALDFMTAEPVTISGDMLAGLPDIVVPLKYTHAFAAIKFELKNEFHRSMRIQKVVLESGNDAALTGDYEIDLISQSVTALNPIPSVELTFSDAGRTEVDGQLTGHAVVNAATLAAGSALTVHTSAGTFRTLTTTDIPLERGRINTISVELSAETLDGKETTASIDNCIGSWRLTSFCNRPADIDIYMTIRSDATFTLYQRNADYTPAKFSGSYIFDAESGRISGVYDDGTAWADSYIVEDADEEVMIWVNSEDRSEISVYTRSDIPASMTNL